MRRRRSVKQIAKYLWLIRNKIKNRSEEAATFKISRQQKEKSGRRDRQGD